MRVISQDGTIDVPYEISSLSMAVGKYEDVEHAAIYCCNSFSTIRMAEYGSEEKAKKAMERLRKIYENNVFYHCTAGSKSFEEAQSILSVEQFQKATTEYFQFPAEEELEYGMEILSFLDAVQRDMADNIYNFCKDGKCIQCGNCCSNLLPMSQKEIDVIRRYIRKKHIKECRHIAPATVAYDMTCPFLDTGKSCEKCRIYPVRPEICKQFICDNEQRAKHNRKLLGQTRDIVDVREEFFGK